MVTLESLLERSRSPGLEKKAALLGRKLFGLGLKLPKVALLGQCTLDYLAPELGGYCLAAGVPVEARSGGYDQVMQDLHSVQADYVILLPWTTRLFGGAAQESELDFWQSCWELAARRGIKVIQVGYDWTRPGPYGHGSGKLDQVGAVRRINEVLRQRLPTGTFFLDLEMLSGMLGRHQFYDARAYLWTRQPFSCLGLGHLARHLAAALRALTVGPRKVLVLDLDNTLWGGEVGEVGPEGVRLDDAFLAFQRYAKTLSQRGVLLALASKNEASVALEVMDNHPDMVLRSGDFVALEIHWQSKSQSLQSIARHLKLGLDTFVFFDDNPRERGEIRDVLPEVTVVEVGDDPAGYIDDLESGLHFEFVDLTEEDRQRSASYQQESERMKLAETVEDYLGSLEMQAIIKPVGPEDLARVSQLVARTNQFNLTTRRHGHAELEQFVATEGAYVRSLRLRDRFGDLGLIAAMVALPQDQGLHIETWLMSCRALQRTVEHRFLADLVDFARAHGFREVIGEYRTTLKNTLVADLYQRLGFTPVGDGFFRLDLEAPPALPTYVG